MFLLKNVLIKGSIVIVLILAVIKAGSMYSDYSVLRYKESQAQEIAILKKEIAAKERQNTELTQQHAIDILKASQLHEKAITAANTEHIGRMRKLEERAAYYKHLSESAGASCDDLRSITTRLDRRIEEGRLLVIELRERLVLRDEQLRIIGQQLVADRELLGTLHEDR